ncbi:MAG TPA: 2'-5' RNA ligase family protein [Candidatus Peribacteraceae bacterium]|nr:2'-5' RNA ligase family protein [Candidatus Peribacteraceae bacterium]
MEFSFPLRSAFLAMPLEGQAKWQFQAVQEELGPFGDFLNFQNPQSPHLTLYFWRELLKIEYDPVIAQAGKIAARTAPFSLHINGFDTFGKAGDERVLFLTVAFSPELATLKKLCPWPNPPVVRGSLREHLTMTSSFHPHITLARIRHPQKFAVQRKKIEKALRGISIDFPVSMIRFYAEVNGQKQTPIADFSFT